MLLPSLRKAFNPGYLTFSDKGAIEISEFLESPDILGINPKVLPVFIANQKSVLAPDRVHMIALHLSRYVRSCDTKSQSFVQVQVSP